MIIPTGHRVLVKKDDIEETTDAGIVIVMDERLEKANQMTGVLVAVGSQAWKAYRTVDSNGIERNGEPWAYVGDKVVFSKFAGFDLEDPETKETLTIMNDDDIGAVLLKESNKCQ